MEAQKPAEGIFYRTFPEPTKWFEVECECSNENHRHALEIELDSEAQDIQVFLYTTQHTPFFHREYAFWDDGVGKYIATAIKDFLGAFLHRISIAWRVIVHGHVEYQADVVLSRQVALNYADALKTAVEEVNDASKISK